ncbi:MAG: leucine-rich repeat domain-containing protein, partial [Alistipes sp.]|nr:leucine-rich repeat domain-containing protein [Alistipes sp.]
EANGYSSNSRQVTVVAGQRISCDIHLTPEADNDVISINPTSIDFGTNELQIAATVTNESDTETEWFLDLGDTPWLYAYPTTGRIGGGKTHSIVFTANRARMNEDKSSVVNISAFGNTHPLSLKCKQSVQLSSVMVVESLNVDFGEEATEQIIRIRNVSETDVNWTLYKVQSERLSMSATHGIVAPGGSQIVTITLDREGLDEVLATTFMISDGTVDQPVNVIAYPTPEGATTTNKIFYTSTDGNIVEPYDPSAFGANIVSNTYEYGQGIITFDGDITSVGKFAFQECENLQSINLPNGVTTIGEQSFYKCGNIISVNVPNSVTSIGRLAFSDCSNLISIILPESVTSIGDTAFAYCSSLTSVNIPNNVTKIESQTFFYCGSLSEVTIPDGVTSIGAMAFQDCVNLTSLIIPESVTYIGGGAFGDCTNLTSINIPEGVTAIEEQTFVGCSNLSEIVIPESMVSIGPGAFVHCSSLTSINIPKGVTTIEERAFSHCRSMTRVDCYPQTPPTLGFDEYYSEYNQFEYVSADCKIYVPAGTYDAYVNAEGWADYKHLIVKPEDNSNNNQILYTTTNGTIVTPVNNATFGANIVSNVYENGQGVITFDGPATAMTWGAFQNCTTLKTVTIPGSITNWEAYIFDGCTNLTTVTILDGVKSIGWGTFEECTKLTEIVMPESVTTIESYAFSGCDALKTITFPNNLTTIGEGAFYDCQLLSGVVIPNSVTSLGEKVFAICPNIGSFSGKFATSDGKSLIDGDTLLAIAPLGMTSYNIPEGITTIGLETFAYTTFGNITMPNSVTTIREMAFGGASIENITLSENLETIEERAFEWCQNLQRITIPNNVTTIGDWVFSECPSLQEITGKFASDDNRCLVVNDRLVAFAPAGTTTCNIPQGITTICPGVFMNCSDLVSVVIPEGVTTIDLSAFNRCSSLVEVTLPSTVTTLESYAFYGCTSVTGFYCKAVTPPSVGTQALYGYISARRIYVPTESVDAYKSASGWSTFASTIVGYDF